ncbi:hypothetical protein [Nocardia pseudobrasiliensis]|uniref:Uncharacterized protein n=1 Tax=Nocardia pseudobrasiliensis TaxID=45979 RepID=A0A370ICC1_9NOCA|nr:hypothetical protein [Nocardia pseudobrasiliensis]RDI68343.1 hypothetical protein DFR76_102744 [Nocardia pseudobrasiliensis]
MSIKRIAEFAETLLTSVAVAVVVSVAGAPATADASTAQCVTDVDASGDSGITCTARGAGVTTTLRCDSTRVISQSGSVYTLFPHSCSGQISGIGSAGATFDGDSPVTVDSAVGAVNAVNTQGFSGRFTEKGNTIQGTCTGSVLSEMLAPFTASIGNATCTTTVDVLGVGAATVTGTGSTLRVVTTPDVAVTITGPNLALTTSTALLGSWSLACATSVTINLGATPIVSVTPCS